MSKVVLGLGFGDEGKGLTTSFLCSQTKNPLVVRFNGGQQAGHTVVYEGKRHVFSSFGSGTLQGVPTYWSKYCTFDPCAFVKEHEVLHLSNNPQVYVHPLCPVTTPFDVFHNRKTEKEKKHGSVGMGFGATIQRQKDYYNLFVQDLYFEPILIAKLYAIAGYYGIEHPKEDIADFLRSVEKVKNLIQVEDESFTFMYDVIFEGAQGILLDMDFGFFPNVTRSNTTSKNAFELSLTNYMTEVYYVTRTYATRHGNGLFLPEEDLKLVNNENETNKSHEYQGKFKKSRLALDLMNYALKCDSNFVPEYVKKNLVITCMDQFKINVDDLLSRLNTKFDKVYVSYGDSLANIIQYK